VKAPKTRGAGTGLFGNFAQPDWPRAEEFFHHREETYVWEREVPRQQMTGGAGVLDTEEKSTFCGWKRPGRGEEPSTAGLLPKIGKVTATLGGKGGEKNPVIWINERAAGRGGPWVGTAPAAFGWARWRREAKGQYPILERLRRREKKDPAAIKANDSILKMWGRVIDDKRRRCPT